MFILVLSKDCAAWTATQSGGGAGQPGGNSGNAS